MRLQRNKFLIQADISQEEKTKLNGKEIFISSPIVTPTTNNNFSPYARAVQVGTISFLPMKMDHFKIIDGQRFDYPEPKLKVGDKVILHHFCIQPDQVVKDDQGHTHYQARYDQIYGVIRKGKIIPLHDYIFCTPVFEPEEERETASGIITKFSPGVMNSLVKQFEAGTKGQFLQQTLNRAIEPIRMKTYAKVEFVCKSPAYGIKVGSIVKHLDKHDYLIPVLGKDYIVLSIHQSIHPLEITIS
jgi:co-chaperonin GroES (HSP10)